MDLSLRLKTIYDMVPRGCVADVGSDHGKLIIALAENEVIPKGYAIENKKGPYSTLVSNITKAGMNGKITPMFSDGISELPSDVYTLVLAGMGGATIIEILSLKEKLHNVSTIIVDAHSMIKEVREYICQELGYNITDEKIIKEDDIYYEIVKFQRSERPLYSEEDYEYGPILRKEKGLLFIEKYEARIKEIDYLLTLALPQNRVTTLIGEREKIRSELK
ncbi:MAG: class I SAM-dependent methyltransferase [Coprobacillus sp.]|nr:class I SAM-dependent methyltransferase [Coprobacillus sp.]